ncbi:PrsW family glutamic-type intramembrane protease [Halapricum desulfuricans]|uniref:PrsW family glutamic-type intramembrane protease n=1 Tax=Halapricum desulfuricans TaxID=2841257 RepID=UPI001E3BA008|nr:hypothetical protein [Halapricum desulfuricans]
MTPISKYRRSILTSSSVVLFFVGSVVPAVTVTGVYIVVLNASIGSNIVAGFTEPITTKLLPAMIIVYLHQRDDFPFDVEELRSYPWLYAGLGGLSFGIVEKLAVIVNQGAEITSLLILSPWVHVLNSVLIAGLLFATPSTQRNWKFIMKLTGVILLGIVIHVFWNTLGVVWMGRILGVA